MAEDNILVAAPRPMENCGVTIGNDFCFHSGVAGVGTVYKAHNYYKENQKDFKTVLKSQEIPIALDANVLLQLYRISSAERNVFLQFLQNNSQRIVIPSQVQIEYLRHRIAEIRKVRKAIKVLNVEYEKFYSDFLKFKEKFNEQMSQFKNKPLVRDMQVVEDKIDEMLAFIGSTFPSDFVENASPQIQEVKTKLSEGIEISLRNAISETEDNVLAAVSESKLLPERTEEEILFLEEKYKELQAIYETHKQDKENKDLYTYPGSGDWRKDKEGFSPAGDFIIYHELMAYMRDNDVDLYFLTNDTTKGDWINNDRKPFFHYVTDTYLNTGHMMYFLDVKDFTTLSFVSMTGSDSEEDDGEHLNKEIQKESPISEETISDKELDCKEERTMDGQENDEAIIKSHKDTSFYKDITPDQFKQILEYSLEWSKDSDEGFVGKEYFIYGYLGRQKFKYKTSCRVLAELIKNGEIEVYRRLHNGKEIACLKFPDK